MSGKLLIAAGLEIEYQLLSQAKRVTPGVDPFNGFFSQVRPDLLIFTVALVAGLHTLCQPLGRDQGICSYIATDILRGEIGRAHV